MTIGFIANFIHSNRDDLGVVTWGIGDDKNHFDLSHTNIRKGLN
jgi:hypothetical protein